MNATRLRSIAAATLSFALGMVGPGAVGAETLEQVARLAQAGAGRLALHTMDEQQPDFAQDAVAWMRWEKERIYILQAQADWAGVIARAKGLPTGVPDDLRRWMLAQSAAAALELGQTAQARDQLRALLWAAPDAQEQADRRMWRRMIIQSYLRDDRLQEADIALQRYRLDYGGDDRDWRVLNSRILLRTGKYSEAAAAKMDPQDPEEQAYLFLAQLRAGDKPAEQILAAARTLADNDKLDASVRTLHWSIVAEAAARGGDNRMQVDAAEKALALSRDALPTDGVFVVSGDPLWDAYVAYGQSLGNARQLLLGQDDAWYFAATDTLQKDPLAARALFATLAEFSRDTQRRGVAYDYLAGACLELAGGASIIEGLYLRSTRFPAPDSIPGAVRYRLIDQALARNDLATASRLMAGLDEPPAGSARSDWQMRRARVLIQAGDIDTGARILDTVVADGTALEAAQLDRLLQVVFDLQQLQEHVAALHLFNRLLDNELSVQQRRELLFWMGESESALQRHANAARLFLESATVDDVFAMDQWAQTARYHAAQALTKAGFPEDAERLYRSLLNATRDESRRAVLRHQIQQLRLMQGSARGSGT